MSVSSKLVLVVELSRWLNCLAWEEPYVASRFFIVFFFSFQYWLAFRRFKRHCKTIRLTDINGDDSDKAIKIIELRRDWTSCGLICCHLWPDFPRRDITLFLTGLQPHDTTFNLFFLFKCYRRNRNWTFDEFKGNVYFRFGLNICFILEFALKDEFKKSYIVMNDTWLDYVK